MNSIVKNIYKLKYIQSEISKREKMIEDMNIPKYSKHPKYAIIPENYAAAIVKIMLGDADMELVMHIAEKYQGDDLEYLKNMSKRLSNFWQNYDQYFKLQVELEDLKKKEDKLKENLGIK